MVDEIKKELTPKHKKIKTESSQVIEIIQIGKRRVKELMRLFLQALYKNFVKKHQNMSFYQILSSFYVIVKMIVLKNQFRSP